MNCAIFIRLPHRSDQYRPFAQHARDRLGHESGFRRQWRGAPPFCRAAAQDRLDNAGVSAAGLIVGLRLHDMEALSANVSQQLFRHGLGRGLLHETHVNERPRRDRE